MASTKFYLDLRGKAADGKGSILIQIFHNHSMTSMTTGIRVLPSEWNGKCIIRHQDAEILNARLIEQKAKLDKAIALFLLDERFNLVTAAEMKREILGKKEKRINGHLISELFNEYMDNGNLKEGTKEIYRATLKKVKAFGGEQLKIESINLKWIRSFDQYLARTQGVNGRSMFLRSFRAVCNYAKHNGIQFQYPFENFQIKSEQTRKRNIPVELLRKFHDYPTTDKNAVYRDYFFLMFYLIGINTADLLLARKSQIVDGRLEYIREKTGKKYSVKLEPEALELLDKYRGEGEYLLEAMDHCKHYRSFAREINDALKLIGDTVVEHVPVSDSLFDEPELVRTVKPVIPGITTYFARHTWATFAYEIGIQMDIISQALGHSFGNKTTLIYVKPDQDKVDRANREVIDYFMGIRKS